MAGGAATGAQVPQVDVPRLPDVPKVPAVPNAPAVPNVPSVPKVPPVPSVPGIPGGGQGAPSVPSAPNVPLPGIPSAGGGTGRVGDRAGAPTSGGSGSAGAVAESGSGARGSAGPASAKASRGRQSGGGAPARERRLRRTVRRLEPCLDAVSSLERRVLVLRSGLGDARPHSRRATARRLGISVERAARAERRGLRRIARADRATGCGYGESGGGFGGGDFAAIAASAPMVAELLGIGPAPAAGREAPGRSEEPPFTDGPTPADDLAAAAEGAVSAAAEGAFPFLVLLALVAMLLASAAVLRGRRLAGDVLDRRAEHAADRRQEELVKEVRNILDDRDILDHPPWRRPR